MKAFHQELLNVVDVINDDAAVARKPCQGSLVSLPFFPMITNTNKLPIYEINGTDVPPGAKDAEIEVASHWNESSKVVLVVDGKRLTVVASDLGAAIRNATNTARHG